MQLKDKMFTQLCLTSTILSHFIHDSLTEHKIKKKNCSDFLNFGHGWTYELTLGPPVISENEN